jgi:hypothetical protein
MPGQGYTKTSLNLGESKVAVKFSRRMLDHEIAINRTAGRKFAGSPAPGAGHKLLPDRPGRRTLNF